MQADKLKNNHLCLPAFVPFCLGGRVSDCGQRSFVAARPAQLRVAGCGTEAEEGGDSKKVLLNLKMLLQPSEEGTVLPQVP